MSHFTTLCTMQEDLTSMGCYDTLFTLLLLWTLELYLILSYRYEDLLISWSYLSYLNDLISTILSLDLRSYHLMMIQDMFLYIITYMHSTCLWLMSFIDDQHAFYTCCCTTCFYSSLQNCPNVWHVETNWLVT